jgi:hypothetical protein
MKYSLIILSTCILAISCKQTWNEKNKSEFMGGCLHRQTPEMGESKAKTYCSCLLEKVMKKYPDASDLYYVGYDTTISNLAKECLKQP